MTNTSDLGTPAVVEPSPLVRVVIRPLTKVLNPAMLKLADRRHVPLAAQIRHVGRKSGRTYVTPVGARRTGEVFVIPLTFGNQSDWSRERHGCDMGVAITAWMPHSWRMGGSAGPVGLGLEVR
jgi:hypothetical protein